MPSTPPRTRPCHSPWSARCKVTVGNLREDVVVGLPRLPARARGAVAVPVSKPPRCLFDLSVDNIADCLSFLALDELRKMELTCRAMRSFIHRRDLWKEIFLVLCRKRGWRIPQSNPVSWKRFVHQYQSEIAVALKTKIEKSSSTIYWRVPLPFNAQGFKQRSQEFEFSVDALGEPVKWQIEVELRPGLPVFPSQAPHPPPFVELPPHTPIIGPKPQLPQSCHQIGLVRIWTTNAWTQDTTRHYFGSHCTISLRDTHNTYDLRPEVHVDIDNSQPYEFDACWLPPTRELLLKVNLTLALEISVPLNPFYALVVAPDGESDTVKVGYCKAIFEVARCKRKSGGTFVRRCDRNVWDLIRLAGDKSTSQILRVEVFQALFNLLGPTSILLPDGLIFELLGACLAVLREVDQGPRSIPLDPRHPMVLMAQNALGSIFNLLSHPLCKEVLSSAGALAGAAMLLTDPNFRICHFSVITVLLTARSWGRLPRYLDEPLGLAIFMFMTESDPLDSECTGVAWDEADIAAFFIPLLRSGDLLCVQFVSWCLSRYYFQPQDTAVNSSYAMEWLPAISSPAP
eukprot:Sspe_Gene.14606::Locus_5057_Transcript_1_1_Confidence_1.000_Length_1769::g.14606::m.14606